MEQIIDVIHPDRATVPKAELKETVAKVSGRQFTRGMSEAMV